MNHPAGAVAQTAAGGQGQNPVGVFWADVEKVGFNPITKQEVLTTRRELTVEYDLPLGQQYGDMVTSFLE